jgi:hypothetical protein
MQKHPSFSRRLSPTALLLVFLQLWLCTLASAQSARTPNIAGTWYDRGGAWVYQFTVLDNRFSWVRSPLEKATGTITATAGSPTSFAILSADWGTGRGNGRVVAVDNRNTATRIQWDNGEVFVRTAGKPQPSPPPTAGSLVGTWKVAAACVTGTSELQITQDSVNGTVVGPFGNNPLLEICSNPGSSSNQQFWCQSQAKSSASPTSIDLWVHPWGSPGSPWHHAIEFKAQIPNHAAKSISGSVWDGGKVQCPFTMSR